MIWIGILVILAVSALGARYPLENENPYYNQLITFFNESHTENGTLKAGLNTSFYDLNITNFMLVVGNVNITLNLNVSGEIYLRGNVVQIEKDSFKTANGTTLPFSNFVYSNITSFLGVDNDSIIKTSNETWVSTLMNNATINRSISLVNYKTTDTNCSALNSCAEIFYSNNLTNVGAINRSIDLSKYNQSINYITIQESQITDLQAYLLSTSTFFDSFFLKGNWSTLYNNEALTRFINANWTTLYNNEALTRFGISNGTSLPFSNFGFANLSAIGNFNINISGSLNVSGNMTFTQLKSCDTINTDANGLLTCGTDATGGDTSAFNLVNYSTEYSSTGYKKGNITIDYPNIDTSLLDDWVLSNYSLEYSNTGFKISNYSTEYASTGFKIINSTDEYSRSGWKIGNMTGNNLGSALSNNSNVILNSTTIANLTVRYTNVTFGDGASYGFTISYSDRQCNSTCICHYINATITGKDCFG